MINMVNLYLLIMQKCHLLMLLEDTRKSKLYASNHYILGLLCRSCLWCVSILDIGIGNKIDMCLHCYNENLESLSIPYSELRKLGNYSRNNEAK